MRLSWLGPGENFLLPVRLVVRLFLFQGLLLSPVLVRHYRVHATASHAQDCPDWELESPIFPWGSSISLVLFQRNTVSLPLVRRYRAYATASHAQDCPDWGSETLGTSYVCVYFRESTAPGSEKDREKTYVLFLVNVSHKNKLICTGWTHLVELLVVLVSCLFQTTSGFLSLFGH